MLYGIAISGGIHQTFRISLFMTKRRRPTPLQQSPNKEQAELVNRKVIIGALSQAEFQLELVGVFRRAEADGFNRRRDG